MAAHRGRGVREISRAQLLAERAGPAVADRRAVDAHDRQQIGRGAGEEGLARRLGLGDGEGPLDEA